MDYDNCRVNVESTGDLTMTRAAGAIYPSNMLAGFDYSMAHVICQTFWQQPYGYSLLVIMPMRYNRRNFAQEQPGWAALSRFTEQLMSPELINTIGTIAGVVVAALGAFLFAFWIAMGIWTFHDIRQRTHDWLVIILAVALVLIFPLIGLILYMMIRPKATLAEVYDRALKRKGHCANWSRRLPAITAARRSRKRGFMFQLPQSISA